MYCLESNDRQTTTKILCIWQTQSSFKYFQSVIGNSVKNWQMWMANCIRFVLVILYVCIRAAFHIVGKLWSSHFWIRVYLLSATCISTTLVLWHLLFHFLFFFSALIFHPYSVAGHSTLVKRAMYPTGTRTQIFQLCPVSLSGRLCCLPVDSTLGWEQES